MSRNPGDKGAAGAGEAGAATAERGGGVDGRRARGVEEDAGEGARGEEARLIGKKMISTRVSVRKFDCI